MFCLYMKFVHGPEFVPLCMQVHELCVYMCFPQLVSILFFETGTLVEPRAH